MGLFDKLFPKQQKKQIEGFFDTLTAYAPTFTTWSGGLYESELVRAAIDAKARHISKLTITMQGAAQPTLQTKMKAAPNEFQTWGQFLYRASTILDCTNTCFIVPVIDKYGDTTGYFPVLPSKCEMVQYNGVPFIRYSFQSGQTAAIEFEKCAVLTKFQYESDFFGDNNRALNPTMKLIDIQNQGIEEGIKSAATYRFMAQMSNFTKPDDLTKERKRFTSEAFQGEGGGLLLFPNTYSNIQQIKSSPYIVDADQMKLINTNVYNYFGVNEDILQNKAYGDAWSAFYEGAIEPFAIQFSDAMTKAIYTPRERAQGSLLMATANRLQYLTNKEKLNVSAQMADRGIMNRDEIREIWNLPPLPNGEGQEYIIRGEYWNAKDKISEGGNEDASST